RSLRSERNSLTLGDFFPPPPGRTPGNQLTAVSPCFSRHHPSRERPPTIQRFAGPLSFSTTSLIYLPFQAASWSVACSVCLSKSLNSRRSLITWVVLSALRRPVTILVVIL